MSPESIFVHYINIRGVFLLLLLVIIICPLITVDSSENFTLQKWMSQEGAQG